MLSARNVQMPSAVAEVAAEVELDEVLATYACSVQQLVAESGNAHRAGGSRRDRWQASIVESRNARENAKRTLRLA